MRWRNQGPPVVLALLMAGAGFGEEWTLARFSADVTVPLGHRLMGILPVKAAEIVDPLEARGFVLRGGGEPIVFAAVDWCEIRNDAYDRWRDVLAEAAGTRRERALVSSIHQHDAPVADLGAERLLSAAGLGGELLDIAFHEAALQRVAAALRESLRSARRATHFGIGQARVEGIASNRRLVRPDGRTSFDRGSSSGGDPPMRDAPEGLIDPWLRTLSFWDGETPLLALSVYAVHPMSYYGRGGVSADFPGMARRRRQSEEPEVFQIYASGCSGDVTAGKFNDGSPPMRQALADRLHRAMRQAWEATRRRPLESIDLRVAPLDLEFHEGEAFTEAALERTLADSDAGVRERILAAMGLASRKRLREGRTIDVPAIDLGGALVVLFPGEAFVGYQWMAQLLRPDLPLVSIGYGECWTGYIPTRAAFEDGFDQDWRWVARGSEARVRAALWRVLRGGGRPAAPAADGGIRSDPFVASAANPRYSEGSVLPLFDGSLLFASTEFIGEESDFAPARIVARSSRDGGRTWSEARVLQENTGKRNVMSASLLRLRGPAPAGIGLFYLQKDGAGDLDVRLRVSTDEGMSFGAPILVTGAPGYHVMNNDRVLQLLDGRLICPIAWTRDVVAENRFVSTCWLSDDGGRSWRRGRGHVELPRRGAMEPDVVELEDGQLLMALRTQLGQIYASRSLDRGETWSRAEPWGVESPEAPATLRRIPSTGDLLLILNPRFVEGAGHGGPRTPLAAMVSKDGGRTWGSQRLLESDAAFTYAYASLSFADGRALISYYVRDESTGRISSRFRSLPVAWFY
jgi:hypothetical protein